MSLIVAISGLLTMCGVVSIRMFSPVFLFLLLMKVTQFFPDRMPEAMHHMLLQTPEILLHPASVIVIGILAAGECVAMYQPDVKEFFTEQLDRYIKPVIAAGLALGFLSTDPEEAMKELTRPEIHQAAISLTALWAVLVGSCTHACCLGRRKLLDFISIIDPSDDLHLQTAENIVEDLLVIGLVVVCLLLPMLALGITLGAAFFAWLIRKLADDREIAHSHYCPHCRKEQVDTLVFKAAFICPVCRNPLGKVYPLAGLGEVAAIPLDRDDPAAVKEHRMDLRRAKRCPACASKLARPPLFSLSKAQKELQFRNWMDNKADPDIICPCCGERIWDEEVMQAYLDRPDGWATFIFITSFLFCILVSFTPFIPMSVVVVLTALIYQPLTIVPLNRYNGGLRRFHAKLIRNFLKLLLFIPILLLSFVPFAGALSLLPLIVHYILVRRGFAARIRRLMKEHAGNA